MTSPYLRWLFCLCLLMLNYLAKAQEDATNTCAMVCCSKDPTPAGIMISHVHGKHELMFSYRFMHMNMGKMISGSSAESDANIFQQYLMSSSHMQMNMHMLMAMYGITKNITLMGMANFTQNSMTMTMLPGSGQMHEMSGMEMGTTSMNMNMNTSGISDTKLYGLFGLIDGLSHHVVFSAGLSMPTGSTNLKGPSNSMYAGQRLPYLMQLGSGSWDLLPGLTWIYNKNNFRFSTQLTSTIRTGYNKVGYKLGNDAVVNSWMAYQWLPWITSSFRAEGNLSGRMKGRDASLYAWYEPAANPANYGGQKITCFLGTNIFINKISFGKTSVGAEFGLPIYQHANGMQMKSNFVINAAANIMF